MASAGKAKSGRQQRLDERAVEGLLTAAEVADEPICVVAGTEEALRTLLIGRLTAQAAGRDVTVIKVSAGEAGAAATIEHATEPTLFGGATWLVLTELEVASDDVLAAAKAALPAADRDLRIVLGHSGAARGRGVLTAADKLGARVFEARPIAAAAVPGVLAFHARQLECVLDADAASAIVEATGSDLTALLATVEQLACDAADGRIDAALVRGTLVSAGSDNQFVIADLVWQRRSAPALAAFRHLAERNGVGSACVTVVAALSYSLRTLTRYVTERPTGSPWQVASALGVPAWKVDVLAAQSKLWRPGQLAAAAVMLADADADAKGGLGEAGALDNEQKMYAVERLILTMAAEPSAT